MRNAVLQRAREVWRVLDKEFPVRETPLHFRTPWELLVAVCLSAQCTDERVNGVTPRFFEVFPDVGACARATSEEVAGVIGSITYPQQKARHIVAAARRVLDVYGGVVPDTMEELVRLPGVGRKTAAVVLFGAFGKNLGLPVDTHVARVSVRLGLARRATPERIERELCALYPRERWGEVSLLLIFHGRKTCTARSPRCGDCPLKALCPSATL